jgi:hypothetical protein
MPFGQATELGETLAISNSDQGLRYLGENNLIALSVERVPQFLCPNPCAPERLCRSPSDYYTPMTQQRRDFVFPLSQFAWPHRFQVLRQLI